MVGVSVAFGQSYQLLAAASDLDDGDGNTNLECLARTSTGLLVGYNGDARTIFTYDASSSTLTALRSASEIEGDISEASPPISDCDAVTSDANDNVYFSLRDDNNDSYVYRINASGEASTIVYQPLNGANSLEATSAGLYVGIVGNFSSLDNGLYRLPLPLTGSDSPDPILNGSSIADISMDKSLSEASNGDLYLVTGDFFTGSEFNKVFRIENPDGPSPSISEFADPRANGPLSEGGGSLYHIEVINFDGADRIIVSNNSFSGTNGEEFAAIQLDGSVSVIATASGIVANTSLSDFAPSQDGGFVLTDAGEIIAASVDGGSFGESGIVSIGSTGLPVELASFDVAPRADGRVAVSWTTLSETNNASFTVQSRLTTSNASTWSDVASKEGQVNSTEPVDYRVVTDVVDTPGTYAFRLKQTDLDGTTSFSDPKTVRIAPLDPVTLTGPNPLRSGQTASLRIEVDAKQTVDVSLYNVLGQRVRSVFRGTATPASAVEATLQTNGLPSGIYFVRVSGATMDVTKRVTLVR